MVHERNPNPPLTIALGGDTMLGRGVGWELVNVRAPVDLWSQELLDVFAEADLAIINLECCISERGRMWDPGGKAFHFRAPPVAIDALLVAGVHAVWLANNHALDFGQIALIDTLDYLHGAGIAWAGAGLDLDAARTGAVLRVGETRIGLIGFADHPAEFAAQPDSPGIAWTQLDRGQPPPWLVAEVRRLAQTCDLVIAGPHWGPNMIQTPLSHHRPVAQALVGAGMSALAGHSAHVPQGIELLEGGAPICYDLGDLLDDYAIDPFKRNDLSVLVLWRPGEWLDLVPLKLEYARTTLAREDDHRWVVNRMREACAEMGTELEVVDGRLRLNLRAVAPTRGAVG